MVYVYVTPFDKSNYRPKIQFGQDITFMHFFSGNESCQCQTPTFSRVLHSIFLTNFLVKSKLSTTKKCKTFSRVFHPKKFLVNSLLNFWTKIEGFEQCEYLMRFPHWRQHSSIFFISRVEFFSSEVFGQCDKFLVKPH